MWKGQIAKQLLHPWRWNAPQFRSASPVELPWFRGSLSRLLRGQKIWVGAARKARKPAPSLQPTWLSRNKHVSAWRSTPGWAVYGAFSPCIVAFFAAARQWTRPPTSCAKKNAFPIVWWTSGENPSGNINPGTNYGLKLLLTAPFRFLPSPSPPPSPSLSLSHQLL